MNSVEVMKEILRMVGTVEFFPSDDSAIANIAAAVLGFNPEENALNQAVTEQIQHHGQWRGIVPFRAIYLECKQPLLLLGPAYREWRPPQCDNEPLDPQIEAQLLADKEELERKVAVIAARRKLQNLKPQKAYEPPDWLQ